MEKLHEKVIKSETLQNKKQLIIGEKDSDLILKSKGKVSIQVGNKITDISKLSEKDPWIPRVYEISSIDFKTGISSYDYNLDLKSFDTIACSWRLSNLDPLITVYNINAILLAGYNWKTYNLHIDIINDTDIASPIVINLNISTIDNEDKFGFETMPIPITMPPAKKAAARYLLFYYDPNLKYWFNPVK